MSDFVAQPRENGHGAICCIRRLTSEGRHLCFECVRPCCTRSGGGIRSWGLITFFQAKAPCAVRIGLESGPTSPRLIVSEPLVNLLERARVVDTGYEMRVTVHPRQIARQPRSVKGIPTWPENAGPINSLVSCGLQQGRGRLEHPREASAQQLIGLLKSHAEGDEDRFFDLAMRLGAAEAQKGQFPQIN